MSWISGNCQDNRHYSCYYAAIDNFDTQWCRDSEEPCPGIDDGGALISVKDNRAPSGGGW
jgi:hypothetical protein